MPSIEQLIRTLKDRVIRDEATLASDYVTKETFNKLLDEVNWLRKKLASITENYVEHEDINADDTLYNTERDTE